MLVPERFLTKRMAVIACAVLVFAAHADAAARRSDLAHSSQLLIVTTPDWNSVAGTLQRYERQQQNRRWRKVGEPISVVVGKAGMGWGDGIVAVPGHAAADPVKHEGDGRSPAGLFGLGTLFGYAPEKPPSWAMPYRPLTAATECVDDRSSTQYNRIVERTDVKPDWSSSEHMRSMGLYYQWGAVIEQNAANKPGDGSCVFLHVSDSSDEGTSGCTAMSESQLEAVLAWLKPEDHPIIVEMPMAQYRRTAKALKLPPQ